MLLSTAISYWHLMSTLAEQTQIQLEKYVIERGRREEIIFSLAEANQADLKQELLRQLHQPVLGNERARFDSLFVRYEDGVIRNHPSDFDGTRQTGVYIDKNLTIDAKIKHRVLTFYDIVTRYGKAWHHSFQDTYITTPENIMVIYWPEIPTWVQDATADLYMPNEEYVWVADKKHNPTRKTVWTGLFYDKVANTWMVSCETPVDIGSKHIATIGHDIILNELLERTLKEHLKDSYNIIFRDDGRLIAHPQLIAEIKARQGDFDILQSGDRHLMRIFNLVKNRQPSQVTIDNSKDREYLAVTKLQGPDWYFVTVFPKSILAELAWDNAQFMLIMSLIALLIEVTVLFLVLRQQVATPLRKLMGATEQIGAGYFNIKLDDTRTDELGQLARLFNWMAQEVHSREENLKQAQAENLRLGAEIEVTRKLQEMLLPKEQELKEIAFLDIAGFMEPANEVGGDYYDVLHQNGKVKIGIGDVTGHGLESGVLMIMVQTAVRTLLTNGERDPVKFLSTINRTIYDNVQRMNSEKNLTLSLLDYSDGVLYLSGQHEEMIVVRSDGVVELIDTIDLGFPIGLDVDIADFIASTRIELCPGDLVVLYTDGITEAENQQGELYGLERLCDVVQQNWQSEAAKIRQTVIDDVRSHIGQHKVYDDITLLVMKQK